MANDISKKTVVLLLVLAIILSVSLTLVRLKDEFKSVKPVEEKKMSNSVQSAQVSLIVEPLPVIEESEVSVEVVDEKG